MPEYRTDLNEQQDSTSQPNPPIEHNKQHEPEDRLATMCGHLLDKTDTVIYAIVGACFLIAALFALGYSFWQFGTDIRCAFNSPASSSTTTPTPCKTENSSTSTPDPNKMGPVGMGTAVIQFVSGLLLVLIIMEVLGTVIHYLKAHAISLRPFLFIGIISATRAILSIGARLSIEGSNLNTITSAASNVSFTHDMIELGVSAAVILALGITLKLLGKLVDFGAEEA